MAVPANPVYIELAGSSNPVLVWDVQNGDSNPGAVVQLYTQTSGDNAQTYLFAPLMGEDIGYYMILNPISGQVISAAWGGVYTDTWNSSDVQKWEKVPIVNSTNFMLRNKVSGYVSTASNSNILQTQASPTSPTAASVWTLATVSISTQAQAGKIKIKAAGQS